MNNRIKEVRKDAHLTQELFGKKIGVTGASVSRLEAGVYETSEALIISICREFGVFREWLETGEGPKYKQKPTGGIEQEIRDILGVDDPFAVACLSALAKMPPQWWELFREELYKKVDEAQKKSSE